MDLNRIKNYTKLAKNVTTQAQINKLFEEFKEIEHEFYETSDKKAIIW
ncbi:MAG: hypothetical protein ACRC6K_03765 [Fusobacteriaceae bacterium]